MMTIAGGFMMSFGRDQVKPGESPVSVIGSKMEDVLALKRQLNEEQDMVDSL